MSYKITMEDDESGELSVHEVDSVTRIEAVKTVTSEHGKGATVIDIDVKSDDDTIVYSKEDNAYDILIGENDD